MRPYNWACMITPGGAESGDSPTESGREDPLPHGSIARSVGSTPEARLLEAAAEGDRAAQATLVQAHLDWVAAEAAARPDRGLGDGDLFQEGTIGLMEAIRRFGSSGAADFEVFARALVGAEIDRALAAEAATAQDVQGLVEAAEQYQHTESGFRVEFGREATNDELAEKLEWSRERTEEVGRLVDEACRRHDLDLVAYLDPDHPDAGAIDPAPSGDERRRS